MSHTEYNAMVTTGRVQPDLNGQDIKHVTFPPAASAFLAAEPGSLFVEFDVDNAQVAKGGKEGWAIVWGPNSVCARLAARKGQIIREMPAAARISVRQG